MKACCTLLASLQKACEGLANHAPADPVGQLTFVVKSFWQCTPSPGLADLCGPLSIPRLCQGLIPDGTRWLAVNGNVRVQTEVSKVSVDRSDWKGISDKRYQHI